jgi:ABC-type transport system involved in multi-copper enzyme maturation permease subunit
MKALLAIEWLKLKRYRTFWWLLAFYGGLLILVTLMVFKGIFTVGANGINILSSLFNFPNVWKNVGFWASMIVDFLAFLMIILVSNEYQFRTNRQNVIDGQTRLQFLHAKYGLVLVLSIGATLFFMLNCIVVGGIASSGLQNMTSGINNVLYFFLHAFNLISFGLLLGLLLKRSGIALSVFLGYQLIVENMLKAFIDSRVYRGIGTYLPLQSTDDMFPIPVMEMVRSLTNAPEAPSLIWSAIAGVFWCCLYYVIARRRILTTDL